MHQQKPATKRKCFTNSALDKREEAQAERRTALLAYVAKQRTEHPDEMTNDDFTEIFTDQPPVANVDETVSIFWDFENLSVTEENAALVARQIRIHFSYIRSFFGVGNTDKLNQNKRRALYKEGVEIKDVPMATGDAADIKILLEISELVYSSEPHTVVVLSNDQDFHPMLKFMRCIGCKVILVTSDNLLPAKREALNEIAHQIIPYHAFKQKEKIISPESTPPTIQIYDESASSSNTSTKMTIATTTNTQNTHTTTSGPTSSAARSLSIPANDGSAKYLLRFGEPNDFIEIDEKASKGKALSITTSLSFSAYLFLETTSTNCCVFQKTNVFAVSVKDQQLYVLLGIHQGATPLYFDTGIQLPTLVLSVSPVKRQKLEDETAKQKDGRKEGGCIIYINGEVAWRSCKLQGNLRWADNANEFIVMGSQPFLSTGMKGVLSNAKLWDCCLSQEEVKQNLELTSKVQPDHLLSYWPLNHLGETIVDIGQAKLSGVLYGSKWILENTNKVVTAAPFKS